MESMSSYFSTGISGAISLSTIAFVTVFSVLTGLTFIIMGVRILAAPFQGGSKSAPPKSKTPPRQAAPAAPAATEQKAQPPASGTSDPRLLAVITAAIAASTSGSFRISRVTPAQGPAAGSAAGSTFSMWRQASRMESFEQLPRQVWKSR